MIVQKISKWFNMLVHPYRTSLEWNRIADSRGERLARVKAEEERLINANAILLRDVRRWHDAVFSICTFIREEKPQHSEQLAKELLYLTAYGASSPTVLSIIADHTRKRASALEEGLVPLEEQK